MIFNNVNLLFFVKAKMFFMFFKYKRILKFIYFYFIEKKLINISNDINKFKLSRSNN